MKLAPIAFLMCCLALCSACGAVAPNPSSSASTSSAPASASGTELQPISYTLERIPFAEHFVLSENEIIRVLDATSDSIYFAVDEKIRGDAYSSGSQNTRRLGVYHIQPQTAAIFGTFEADAMCYQGISSGDAFFYSLLQPIEATHLTQYQIFLHENDVSHLITQGVCSNLPTYTPTFARYGNEQIAFSYANMDDSGKCTDFGIRLVDRESNVTALFSRKQSEESRFINSRLCSNGNRLLYFTEENGDGLFYLFENGGWTTFPLEAGKKTLEYCMLEDGVLLMLSPSEDSENGDRDLSFYQFSSQRWESHRSKDFYRMESNGKDLALAIDSTFAIYLLRGDSRQPIELPDVIAAKNPKNVRFFNVDSNRFFLFFENPYELMLLTLNR